MVHTGWDDPLEDGSVLRRTTRSSKKDAAEYLVRNGAALVGIDSLNIDDTEDGYVGRSILCFSGAEIPIAEHLCGLDQLPDQSVQVLRRAGKSQGFWNVSLLEHSQ